MVDQRQTDSQPVCGFMTMISNPFKDSKVDPLLAQNTINFSSLQIFRLSTVLEGRGRGLK